MKLSAVIFDLNGTVLADEAVFGRAFSKVLGQFGFDQKTDYPHTGGIGVEENWRIFKSKYKLRTSKTVEELAAETLKEYKKMTGDIRIKKGFETLASDLSESGVKLALATSSTWEGIEEVLDKFNLETYFDVIVTGEEVNNKKPSPEIFMIAAERLYTDPSECLVFEDSQSGIDAAISAGMKVAAIYRDKKHKSELEGANLFISDFTKITPEKIADIPQDA